MDGNIAALFGHPQIKHLFTDALDRLRDRGNHVEIFDSLDAVDPAFAERVDILAAPGFMPLAACDLVRWSRLRGVVAPFIGIEGFEVAGLTARSVAVANGHAPENSISTAEATLTLMLAASYDLEVAQEVLRGKVQRPAPVRARMIGGRAVGILGYGQVAKAAIARLSGWDVPIQVYARTPPSKAPVGVRFVGLEQLVRESDILLVLASLNSSSHHILTPQAVRHEGQLFVSIHASVWEATP